VAVIVGFAVVNTLCLKVFESIEAGKLFA